MIAYFDTSALLPLLLQEPGTAGARRLWNAAVVRISSRLLYVEAAAALARARRANRLTEAQCQSVMDLLDDLWDHLYVVDAGETLVREAAGVARHCGLRGYDAVHCASARQFIGGEVVMVSSDQELLAACHALGLATADPMAQ